MKNLTNNITAENKTLLSALDAQIKLQGLTKGNAAYKCIAEALSYNCNWLRPATTAGSGKYTHTQDLTAQVTSLLKKINIKFEVSNDSPKGGKTGTLIKFTKN